MAAVQSVAFSLRNAMIWNLELPAEMGDIKAIADLSESIGEARGIGVDPISCAFILTSAFNIYVSLRGAAEHIPSSLVDRWRRVTNQAETLYRKLQSFISDSPRGAGQL